MKKLFLILALFPLVMTAQENSIVVGVSYASVFSNYQFDNPAIDAYGWRTQHAYKSKYNYSAGLSVEYRKKILWGGRIAYVSKGYVLDYNFTAIDPDDPYLPKKSTVEAGYLDIGGIVGYPVTISHRVLVIPTVNLTYSTLINNKITTLSGDNKEYVSRNGEGIIILQALKQHLFSTGIGMEARLPLWGWISLGIALSLYYTFDKVSDKAIKANSVFYTLNLGLYFKINRNDKE